MSSKQTLVRPSPQTTTWQLDVAHSRAEFAVRHLMIATVRGTIPIKRATIVLDELDITKSRIEAELDVAGVDTRAPDRDAHLRSPDFFDAANHPTIAFRSTRIEAVGDGPEAPTGLRVHGDLTIRGTTRPVVLDVDLLGEAKDPWGNVKAAASATTTFDRRDFGLTWNVAIDDSSRREGAPQRAWIETGGVLVADKVKVQLDLQFAKET